METFVSFESWRGAAVFLNLVAFFCGFSAFSVGLLILARVRRHLEGAQGALLRGLIHAFLVASGALALRSLAIVLFHLALLPAAIALPVSDVALVVVGGALFWGYLALERFLSKRESG